MCALLGLAQLGHPQLASSSWPDARANYGNTGQGTGFGTIPALKWSFAGAASQPAIGPDGTIFLSDATGTVGLDRTTGSVKWQTPALESSVFSPAVGADGTVYIVGSITFALDGGTGKVLWSYNTGAPSAPPVIGPDGTVYVNVGSGGAAGDADLYALNGKTGALNWSSPLG